MVDQSADQPTVSRDEAGPPPTPAQQIGPYRILDILGEGGFGVVYLAERREPHVQRVALKVIKPGMDSKAVLARFEQERQALAVMDHPNVAHVLDAGVTPEGRPYFVMEHVRGQPITDYCDLQRLSIRQRLELFIPVCDAVQHAHAKGVIHRDIKPSNILVSVPPEGGDSHSSLAGAPKIIDFGVAKAIGQAFTDKTIFTEQGQIIGTPEYMSPEQAEMSITDIDTRSDVYSLGALLYELLTGSLPFDADTLRAKGYAEIQRIIREVDPPRPSTRVAALGDAIATKAAARKTRPADLAGQLRRELEWIPLRAMRKERTERYQTPRELADDIRNYLDGRPLVAGPESAWYRARKFVRRRKVESISAAVVALALLAATIFSALAARSEARQRRATEAALARAEAAEAEAAERADDLEQVASFQASQLAGIDTAAMGRRLRDTILEQRRAALDAQDADARLADLETALEGVNFTDVALDALEVSVFDRALAAIDADFGDQPLVQARLLQTMANVLIELGLLDRAETPQMRALDIRRERLSPLDDAVLASINDAGMLRVMQGRFTEAEAFFREALDLVLQTRGPDDPETLSMLNNIGVLLEMQGRMEDAASIHERALEGHRRVFGDDDPATLVSLNRVAILRWSLGEYEEAHELAVELVETSRRVNGEDHPDTLTAMNTLAGALMSLGRYDEAIPLFRDALDATREVYGDRHQRTIVALSNLGGVEMRAGDLDAAERHLGEALAASRSALGDGHPTTLGCAALLAGVYEGLDRLDEAERLWREAYIGRRAALGETHIDTLQSMRALTGVLIRQRQWEEAERLGLECRRLATDALGEGHPLTDATAAQLRDLYTAWHEADPDAGHDEQAAEWAERAGG